MIGSYDWVLVAMSLLIAIVASYTALDLAGRARASSGSARHAWLTSAAVAMGGGIWAMHFVAMLAYSMPGMAVSYDVGVTLLSLVVPIVATTISFSVMNRGGVGVGTLAAAGLFMGLAVVAMHYVGMAAMRMPASVRYDRLWVAMSVLIAVGAATTALFVASKNSDIWQRIAAAGAMGVAIAGMHFSGMRAASFDMAGGMDGVSDSSSLSQTMLALTVSAAALLILFLALVAAMFDRRFAELAAREALALRDSEERFRALYRGTPLPLHSLDAAGRIEHVSDTWLQLTGYDRSEVIGRPITDFLVRSCARRARRRDRVALVRDGALIDQDYQIVTKTGAVRDVVASARLEMSDDGAFQHVLGGLTDVTDRKRAEEALRQAQKIEAIGQLTGGIAHDFNNLLAVVIGNLDLLGRQVSDDPRAQRLVANARKGAERGASLTQRLLAFARRQDLRPESVDVRVLVHGLSEMIERSFGPQIRIETAFPDDLPNAHVDAHQLELAILNMAVNARDAMPDGGTLTISASQETLLDTDQTRPQQFVRLEISDTGIGMDENTLMRASEPFFTTKGVGKGTGLGLSMVQGLAEQSEGKLRLSSVLGQGTKIMLCLPVATSKAPVAAIAAAQVLPRLRKLTILAVDDDDLVLQNTAAMLEECGHEVITASSGQEALGRIRQMPQIDLLVSDQLMPGMTGVQLARTAREIMPQLRVLLVSGFADLEAQDVADFSFLKKPFDQAALEFAVASTCAEPNSQVPVAGLA